MRKLLFIVAGAAIVAAQPSLRAAQITSAGVFGNSGEQGSMLVRFGTPTVRGIGVIADETGSLWDRGGDGVLNRYALDGRLLATYKIPSSKYASANDKMTRVGNQLVLLINGKLNALPLDAAPGSSATALGVSADLLSFGSVNGSIAIATQQPDRKSYNISLCNLSTKAVTPVIPDPVIGLREIELLPDGGVVGLIDGKLHLYRDGKEVLKGWPRQGPGSSIQFLDGYWYGAFWHGTLRRFNAELEPDPGVVLGGKTGAFIGRVDENTEVGTPRGVAKIRDGLFAVSGVNGIMHLIQWDQDKQQFSILRRIGAIPECQGLGINRQGQVWFNTGHWNWSDRPGDPMQDCTPAGPGPDQPGVGQLVLLPNDNFVAPSMRYNYANVLGGPFSWNVNISELKTTPANVGYLNGSAVYTQKNMLVLLAINGSGKGLTYRIDNTGRMAGELGPVALETATPVKEWTSLALKNNETLLGAADGFIIEMTRDRDGSQWKESNRWNTWQGAEPSTFGRRIYICVDAGNLWVSDTERNRVLCFTMADHTLRASFGTVAQTGDDLVHLNAPRAIAAREKRAVVFDSGNQRLLKLLLSE